MEAHVRFFHIMMNLIFQDPFFSIDRGFYECQCNPTFFIRKIIIIRCRLNSTVKVYHEQLHIYNTELSVIDER